MDRSAMVKPIKIRKMKATKGERIFAVCNYVILTLLTLTFIFPFLNVLATALNSSADTALGGLTFYPREFTMTHFKVVFNDAGTWKAFTVSVTRVIVACAVSIVIEYFTAYALNRRTLPFKGFFAVYFMVPMFISGGLISQFIVYADLGIYNTFLVYIIPSAFSFYNTMILCQYMKGIPQSLCESARLDGARELTIIIKIMMPLSMPIIATVLLWTAVAHWNTWTDSMYFVLDENLHTLQYYLQKLINNGRATEKVLADAKEKGLLIGELDTGTSAECLKSAQIIFTSLPIICIYPFLQKYFVSGVMIGSVKE